MENFEKTIKDFSKQLSSKNIFFLNSENIKNTEKIDAIVLIGMGGSGQVGDIILNLKSELGIKIPVLVWKDWGLPTIKYKNPLYIFISFSGNTEETISGISNAKNKALVASGGKIMQIAKKQKLPIAYFSNNEIKPRQAGGILFFAVTSLLKKYFPEIKINNLEIKNWEKRGKSIAQKIKNKIALLYSSSENYYLAYNWKTRLNETSKTPAFSGIIPEICHNEIEIFENNGFKKQSIVILFEDKNDRQEIKKRMEKVKKIFTAKKINFLIIKTESRDKSENAFNSLVLADWVSYYLAKGQKINPAQTKLIDALKKLR